MTQVAVVFFRDIYVHLFKIVSIKREDFIKKSLSPQILGVKKSKLCMEYPVGRTF